MSSRAVLENWFENVWNKQDESYIRENLTPDFVLHGIGNPEVRSQDAFIEFWRAITHNIVQIHVSIIHFNGDDDGGCGIAEATGRDNKTDQEIQFRFGVWFRLENGLIAESENVIDFFTYLTQIGVIDDCVLQSHLFGE